MVRDLIDILRSSATNRRGPMRPVWNGDETEWALDSCLLGHYRYVSFPGVDSAQAQTASGDSEVLPAIEVTAPTTTSARPAARPARGSTAAPRATRNVRQGFCLPDRADAGRRYGNRCRQGAGSDQCRWCCADRANRLAEHCGRAAATRAGPHHQRHYRKSISCRAYSFEVLIASPVAGTPQGLAVYQNGMRINEAFGDTVNWDLIPTSCDQVGHRRDQQSRVRPQRTGRGGQRADEERLQLSGRRNQHDGRFVRAHPEFGAVWQADRQFFGLWRARRRARQRISQFLGIGDPALLRRCRLPDR